VLFRSETKYRMLPRQKTRSIKTKAGLSNIMAHPYDIHYLSWYFYCLFWFAAIFLRPKDDEGFRV